MLHAWVPWIRIQRDLLEFLFHRDISGTGNLNQFCYSGPPLSLSTQCMFCDPYNPGHHKMYAASRDANPGDIHTTHEAGKNAAPAPEDDEP